MAAVRHLGIVVYGTTHEVLSLGHISLSNFMQIRPVILKLWRIEFVYRFGLKCLFTSPFRFLGSGPLNVIGHHQDPQEAHPWPKPRLHANFGTDRYTDVKESKKGKERNLQWQTGCSPRPPTLTQRYVVLHAGWSSGDSSQFHVSSI